MTLSVLSYPKFRSIFPATGEPNAGGYVHTYVAGTLTIQTTYSDANGVHPNANPIQLDSNGECNIWLLNTNNAIYDIVVTDNTSPVVGEATVIESFSDIQSIAINNGSIIFSGDLTINNNKIVDANQKAYFTFQSATSAINNIKVQNSAAGSGVALSAIGTDITVDFNINSKASHVVLDGIKYPNADGTNGQVLTTNGSGLLNFTDNGITAVAGTSNRITVTGSSSVSIDIAAGYVGQATITTLGTIVTGTWNASTITVSHGGTGLITTTAYAVICGGTTSTGPLQSVASVGTSGYVLTSNGAGALPTFQASASGVSSVTGTTNRITSSGGATPAIDISASYVGQSSITTLGTIGTGVWQGTPVTVTYGGSGRASTTAYAVLCGGTTSTGAEQSIASVGTAGQVLTSNGAGALPTFQASGGGGGTVYPKDPSFRLTVTSNDPVDSDQGNNSNINTLYYTPYKGNSIDLYDGVSAWATITSAQITITIPATTNTGYDVFVYNNSGTATVETLAWTNLTTRATALILQDGVLVKSGATTRRYVGSFRTNGVSGHTDMAYDKLYVWNYYNRSVRKLLLAGDSASTASWAYTTATWRQARANAANQVAIFCGWIEDNIELTAGATYDNSTGGVTALVGVGNNSTTGPDASVGGPNAAAGTGPTYVSATSVYTPAVGYNYYPWCEYSAATGTTTWHNSYTSNTFSGIVGFWKC